MRRTTIETLTAAVRGGRIVGMDTSGLPSISNGQFIHGRAA